MRILFLVICMSLHLQAFEILQSPKGAETFPLKVSKFTAPIPKIISIIVTNDVTEITFKWDDSNPSDHTYELYYGGASSTYTNHVDVGTNTQFTFTKTNWSEADNRHWFAVVSVNSASQRSGYSNERFCPLYPPDRFTVTWLNPAPATLLTSTNLFTPWLVINRSQTGTTEFLDMIRYPMQLFRLVRSNGLPDTLKITVYNPLNQ